ncbi:hypothetical protein MKW98_005141 [Papaver atlanticum]|uniref:Ammonium transporter AmtB-like domain-containing protein n=1 Tax=Papaver atlanticum TaxID=357466 RepID=A0AAD4X3R4_9MAGN|nr:hypothetical protein MKW98_005141 [Papaver atlanticum]
MAANVSTAYLESLPAVPDWLNKGDNAWQLIAATLVALQGMPGLVILYGSIVKKKWAVNSAFMALYAFAAVLLLWVLVCYKKAFGEELLPFWGRGGFALGQGYLLSQGALPATPHFRKDGVTLMLLAGAVLGRMNIRAWMAFVPLWLIFSYTVGAFSLWGGGFLYHWGVIDFAGGYVVHLSSGVAGFTAVYWVRPRMKCDKERFPPNNVLLALAGAGLLWTGWSGFNGGAPYAANIDTSIAVLNTNICAATSLLMWTSLDVFYFGKPSVIGAIQGMITGLVCITPGAGVVQAWAAMVMGILAGSIPWFTMMILHKKSSLLQKVDDTLGVFHTHAVAGILGGTLTVKGSRGVVYGGTGGIQLLKQLVAALFIILLLIRLVIPLRMPDDELLVGDDDAAHGEEAYALWGDGERYDESKHADYSPKYQQTPTRSLIGETGRGGAVGV